MRKNPQTREINGNQIPKLLNQKITGKKQIKQYHYQDTCSPNPPNNDAGY